MNERTWISLTRQRSNRSDRGKPWSNVQVDQAPIQFCNRCAVLPAHPRVQSELRAHSPVIRYIGVVNRFAKILVRVAESNGARVGNAQQKVGKIRTARSRTGPASLGRCACERKIASRVLLRQIIELLPAKVSAKGQIVPLAAP